jgi:hypothetical protein
MGIFEVGKRELFLNEAKLTLYTYCTKFHNGKIRIYNLFIIDTISTYKLHNGTKRFYNWKMGSFSIPQS